MKRIETDRIARASLPAPSAGAGRSPDEESPRATICRSCTTRDCCTRPIEITIAELGSIARTLELPPTLFVELSGDSADPTLRLVRRDGNCVFLLHLATHKRVCGLGSLAPLACRRFPAEPGAQTNCWRTWSDDELHDSVDLDAEAQSAVTVQAGLVSRWQTRLATRHHELGATMALDALLSLAAELEP
jgi:Fe-S-cluster containining protein